MKVLYNNIDYLQLQLSGLILEVLPSIKENSPRYTIGDYHIEFRSSFQNKYVIYDIFYKKGKIASINWIKNEKMAKRGVFLDFAGMPLRNFGIGIIDDFLKNIDEKKIIPFRIDYCVDYEGIEVLIFLKILKLEKLSSPTFPIRYSPKNKKPTRFSVPFVEDKIRVYNKKLDILDRKTYEEIPAYKEYLKNQKYITRIEVQLNRGKIKNYDIKTLEDCVKIGESVLKKKIIKFFDTGKINEKIKSEIERKQEENLKKISEKKKYLFAKKMFNSYFETLLSSRYGAIFLKNNKKLINEKIDEAYYRKRDILDFYS